MALINWDDSLSVGIASIDLEHQKLVSMINDLHDSMRNGKGTEVIGKILAGLLEYTGTHFKTEERLFDQHGYSQTGLHIAEHADFVKRVTHLKGEFDRGRIGLTIDVIEFLKSWLTNHIKGTDKKYSAFLIDKGVR